jgi:hypothetical protein
MGGYIADLLMKKRLQDIAMQAAPQFQGGQVLPQQQAQPPAAPQIQQEQAPPVQLPVTGFDPALRGQISTPSGPPESQNMDAISQYKRAIADQPMHQDADPISKKRRLAGILLGATQGLANQGAGSRGEQMRQGVFDAPYNRKLADYNQELAKKQQLAQIQTGEEDRQRKIQDDIIKAGLQTAQTGEANALAGLHGAQTHNLRTPEELNQLDINAKLAEREPKFFLSQGTLTTVDPNTGQQTTVKLPGNMSKEEELRLNAQLAMTREQFKAQTGMTKEEYIAKQAMARTNVHEEGADKRNKDLIAGRKDIQESKPTKPTGIKDEEAARQAARTQLRMDPKYAEIIGHIPTVKGFSISKPNPGTIGKLWLDKNTDKIKEYQKAEDDLVNKLMGKTPTEAKSKYEIVE